MKKHYFITKHFFSLPFWLKNHFCKKKGAQQLRLEVSFAMNSAIFSLEQLGKTHIHEIMINEQPFLYKKISFRHSFFLFFFIIIF